MGTSTDTNTFFELAGTRHSLVVNLAVVTLVSTLVCTFYDQQVIQELLIVCIGLGILWQGLFWSRGRASKWSGSEGGGRRRRRRQNVGTNVRIVETELLTCHYKSASIQGNRGVLRSCITG